MMIKLIAFVIMFFSCSTYAGDIEISWTKPEVREDGSEIETIDKFNLYHSIDNVSQSVIEVDSTLSEYTVSEAATGIHSFQISAVEAGNEGQLSGSISVSIETSSPAKMQIEVIVRVIK